MDRKTMIEDLAKLGINGLDKLADGGVKKIYNKYFPVGWVDMNTEISNFNRSLDALEKAAGITPEQVDEALEAILPQSADRKE
jgi:hypothetical protein